MKLNLKKGDKVKVIDDLIFPDNITIGTVGWVQEIEPRSKGLTYIAFYPNGDRFDYELDNQTDFISYLERTK